MCDSEMLNQPGQPRAHDADTNNGVRSFVREMSVGVDACRVCLRPAGAGARTLQSRHRRTELGDMLFYCFPFTNIIDEKYPQSICHPCLQQLIASYAFKKTYNKTEETLRRLFRGGDEGEVASEEIVVKVEVDEEIAREQFHAAGSGVGSGAGSGAGSDDGDDAPLARQATAERSKPKKQVKKVGAGKLGAGGSKQCAKCEFETSDRAEWMQHLKVHPYTRVLCTYCAKGFKNQHQLDVHIRSHTKDRPFTCATCGAGFTQKRSLSDHELAVHRKERPYACQLCDAKFSRKESLVVHGRTHAAAKPFPCPTCEKHFSQPTNLTAHIRTHNCYKPYACGECEFRSAYASALKLHARRHHGGARGLACDHCPRTFKDSAGLSRHRRVHAGELPFQCAHCPRAFKAQGNRVKHVARAHPAARGLLAAAELAGRPRAGAPPEDAGPPFDLE